MSGFCRCSNRAASTGGDTTASQTFTHGFRNPPGIHSADICFVGDSYTEGANVPAEKTFASLVGSTSGLRTVNLGRGWHCPAQELIILRRYALKYKPRVIVWGIFEGNDL